MSVSNVRQPCVINQTTVEVAEKEHLEANLPHIETVGTVAETFFHIVLPVDGWMGLRLDP